MGKGISKTRGALVEGRRPEKNELPPCARATPPLREGGRHGRREKNLNSSPLIVLVVSGRPGVRMGPPKTLTWEICPNSAGAPKRRDSVPFFVPFATGPLQ